MNIYVIGFIVPIASFVLQIWPRVIKRYFGVDTWRSLLFADFVRKHKSLPTESPNQFIIKTVFGYPPVLLLFLALFSKKFLEKYQFVFSPFFDLLNNYLIFAAAYMLSRDFQTAIISQIIAALSPINVMETTNLNTRVLSTLIFNISFFTLLLFTLTLQPLWIIISGISLFVLFFTHRFAVQTYLVLIITFTFFEKNIFYVLYFIFIFGLVYIFGGKLYKAILNEHVACLKFWVGKSEYRFAHQIRGIVKQAKIEDFTQKAYSVSINNPIFFVFASNPWLILVFAIAVNSNFNIIAISSALSNMSIHKFEIWIGSLLVWAVVVLGVKKLQNFGDGQRYIGYCVLPTALIIGSFSPALINKFGIHSYIFIFPIAALMLCLIIFLQYKVVILDRSRSITKEVWEIIKYINTHSPKKINLAMFPQQMGDAILYFTKCRILTSNTLIGLEQLNDFYPVLKKPMSEIIKKYKINHIYFDRNYVTLEELKLKRYKVVADINDYVLLKV